MKKNIAFIGGGNIARSLIGGLRNSGYPAEHILVADPASGQLEGLARDFGVDTTIDNNAAAEYADILVFAVKPQILGAVAQGIASTVRKSKPLILSVAAGIREADLNQWLGGNLAIVRSMPNSPALHRCGITALCANTLATREDEHLAANIMQAVGKVIWLDTESLMDPVTAVSGTGPAYFFFLMECIEEAARQLGLDANTARTLTVESAYGAARMARDGDEELSNLRLQVTSPGGTTAAAMSVLDGGGVRALLEKAVRAANNRSEELSREFGKH